MSSDEEEEEVPDEITFDVMAKEIRIQDGVQSEISNPNDAHIPLLLKTNMLMLSSGGNVGPQTSQPTPPQPHPSQNNGNGIDWTAIINAAHNPGNATLMNGQGFQPDDLPVDGHIFRAEAMKPEYQMNVHSIPKPILQMAYLHLFIPLSLLMTTSLDKIQCNNGLKYHKIPLGNGAGKNSLDVSTFPTEFSLSESEFWQAY